MKKFIYIVAATCIVNAANGQNGNVGIGTTTPKARLHVADSSVLFTGPAPIPLYPGNPPISGLGGRMMWYAEKAAFRAGLVDANQWDKDSIGAYSIAMSASATASGAAATSIGWRTNASGYYSIALGYNTISRGQSSFASGSATLASGYESTAMGLSTKATGAASVAMNHSTTASGPNATAMGFSTTASGNSSTALGSSTIAPASSETVIGSYNEDVTLVGNGDDPSDQLFVIGNGVYNVHHNALTLLRNGQLAINTSIPLKTYEDAQVSVLTASSEGVHIKSTSSDLNGLLYLEKTAAASNIDQFVFFRANGANIGSIIANSASSVAYNTTSDERLKENIRATNLGLKNLLKIKVEDYNYKADKAVKQTGFIAQQLYNIYPMAVTKGGTDVSKPWMVDYSKLTPLLVKAIQDQQKQIEADRKEISAARNENKELRKRLEAIETALKLKK